MRLKTCSAGLVAWGVLALTGTAEAKMICPMGDVDGSGNAAMAGGSGPSGSDRTGSDAPLTPAGASSTTPAPASGGTGRPAATAPAQGSPGTAVAEVPASAVADVPATTSVPASTGAAAPASVPAPVTTTAAPATAAPAPVAVPAGAPAVDLRAQAAAERAARRAAERRAERRAAARRAAARRAATTALRARVAYQASFEPGTGSAWVERPASPLATDHESGSDQALAVGLGLAGLLGLALAAVALLRRRGSGGTAAVTIVAPLDPAAHADLVEAELQEIIAEERAAGALEDRIGSGTR